MIKRRTRSIIIIISILALAAGFESAVLTLLLCQPANNQMSLLTFAFISRLARWSMNPLLVHADQMIEKDNNVWQFSKCQNWLLGAIREPAFQKDLALRTGQIEKIRQLIIMKILPAISSVTTAMSLVLILSIDKPRHLPVIALVALLETVGQSIRAKYSHSFDLKSLDPARKYYYLKSQMASSVMLREHRVCQSLSAVITETQRALSVLHHMKRQFYTRVQIINVLVRVGQGLCILIPGFSGLRLFQQPLPPTFNIASLGVIYGAFRLIRSGSQLGQLPAIFLELRLCMSSIKLFDKKYNDDNINSLHSPHSQQIKYLKSIKRTEVTALSGPNGSGKSTLILAIAQELSMPQQTSPAGFLFQNFGLIQSSIKNNIVLYKKSDISSEDIDKALTISGFMEVMLKYGWDIDTEVGEEMGSGRGISLGEWQKLALARAIYHSKEYLILDEPDAHLDLESSKNFERQIKMLKQNTKLIIASHSKNLLNHADNIIRL